MGQFRWAILSFLAVTFLWLTTAASAATYCDTYYDSRSASSYGEDFCWLSGAICYECYDTDSGESCTDDWKECNPYPPIPEQQTASLQWIDPADASGPERGCVLFELSSLTAADLL